jgi:hypothetical protein
MKSADQEPIPPPAKESASWSAFVNLQTWLIAGIAITVIPSGIAAIGGVWLNGGHALQGPLSVGVNVVLVVSLTCGLAVTAVGFKRFLTAQAKARRARQQNKSRKAD